MNIKFSNFNKRTPIKWGIWQDALTTFFSGLILIIPSIRFLSDNSKTDIGMVWIPIALLIVTVIGRFSAAKEKPNDDQKSDDGK